MHYGLNELSLRLRLYRRNLGLCFRRWTCFSFQFPRWIDKQRCTSL